MKTFVYSIIINDLDNFSILHDKSYQTGIQARKAAIRLGKQYLEECRHFNPSGNFNFDKKKLTVSYNGNPIKIYHLDYSKFEIKPNKKGKN